MPVRTMPTPKTGTDRSPSSSPTAVVAAHNARQPAQIGSGTGFLYGHSINRRWLDRPVDPGVTVLRVDDAQGNLLGLWSNFACHSVVLGSDNLQLSGDWPGYAMRRLEEQLGAGATCLFTQGGAGNINPLVAGVRKQLRNDITIRAIGDVSAYYGPADDPNQWNIGDRKGGTFAEVAELGDAFAEEVAYIAKRIVTTAGSRRSGPQQVTVNAAADPDEHPVQPNRPVAYRTADRDRSQQYPCRDYAVADRRSDCWSPNRLKSLPRRRLISKSSCVPWAIKHRHWSPIPMAFCSTCLNRTISPKGATRSDGPFPWD